MSEKTCSTSTYVAYKKDTNTFVSWLGATAKACGWKPPKTKKEDGSATHQKLVESAVAPELGKGPRLKGKERKEAKARAAAIATVESSMIHKSETSEFSAKYTVTTGHLVQQIDIVAKSVVSASMPRDILAALKRAIRKREKFMIWHQKTNHSTESHGYFIDILRCALGLFSSATSKEDIRDSGTPESQSGEKFMANMFAALEIEDVADEESEFVPVPQTTSPGTSTGNSMDFVLEETEADVEFAIFSLFEDIHRIRSETKEIIRRLAAEEIGLVHATLSIAAALELVRQADNEVNDLVRATGYENYEENFRNGSYSSYVAMIYSSEALGRAHVSLSEQSTLKLDPFDEFVMLPLGYTLNKIRYFADHPWCDYILKQGRGPVPFPLPPLRFDSEFYNELDAEKLNDPRVQKAEADDQLLVQLYQDMVTIESIKDGRLDNILVPTPGQVFPHRDDGMKPGDLKSVVLNSTLPYFDVLHDAFRSIWTQKVISMSSAFAAQTLVDMHDICGSSMSGTQRQIKEVKFYVEQLGFVTPNDEDGFRLSGLDLPQAPDSRELVVNLYKTLECCLTAKPQWTTAKAATLLGTNQVRERWVREANTERYTSIRLNPHLPEGWEPSDANPMSDPWAVNITGIWPNDSPTFLMDNNPLYGGTALLDVASSFELASIAIANESMSIMCMAYLYNAARQLGLLQVRWVEMDKVIDQHVAAIFANDIPTTPQSMFERFKYRLGISLSKSQVASRSFTSVHKGGTVAPWKLKPSRASTMINQTLNAQLPLPRLLYWLEAEASQSNKQRQITHGQKSCTKGQNEAKEDAEEIRLSKRKTTSSAPRDSQSAALVPTNISSQRQISLRQTLQRIERHLDDTLPDINYLSLTRTCDDQLAKLREKLASKLNVKGPLDPDRMNPNHGFGPRIETTIALLHENMVQAQTHEAVLRKNKKRANKDRPALGQLVDDDGDDVKPIGRQLAYCAKFLTKMLSKGSHNTAE